MCWLPGLSRSGYYEWRDWGVSSLADDEPDPPGAHIVTHTARAETLNVEDGDGVSDWTSKPITVLRYRLAPSRLNQPCSPETRSPLNVKGRAASTHHAPMVHRMPTDATSSRCVS
jgi:hypothetical protein